MSLAHVASIKAYERKAEVGGGFRGTFYDRERKEKLVSDVLESREAAIYWAKTKVHERFAERGYKVASARRRKGAPYRANIWC